MDQEVESPGVLVVDDDPMMRLLLREALESAGFVVTEASDGERGLEAFQTVRPAAILLDVMMPGMDGFEVCRGIRAAPGGEHVPVLVMTALDDTDSVRAAYEAGATDFIVKPIHWSVLGYRLRYILRASRAMSELASSRSRLAEAQRLARLGNWEWEVATGRVLLAPEACRLAGCEPHSPVTLERVLEALHDEDQSRLAADLEAAARGEAALAGDYRLVKPGGGATMIHAQAERVVGMGGGVVLRGTVQDITERKEVEERIRRLAYYDSLTGLPNRSLFKERLSQALSRAARHGERVAVMFIDLDQFKRINDTLGHSAGDQLLEEAARRILQSLRAEDLVAREGDGPVGSSVSRLGGDEFTVLLSGFAQVQDVTKVAQRILAALKTPIVIQGQEVVVSGSVGIAVYPFDGETLDVLLMNADAAMYHAKEEGRDNFQFYSRAMNAQAFERLSMENGLRRAVERRELLVYFQPVVVAETGLVSGVEALVRWRHPELGLLLPGNFVRVAEESGLIEPISEWVTREACRQLTVWDAAGLPSLRVAVNVSPVHMRDPDYHKSVARILAETGLPPNRLDLEVTEATLMEDRSPVEGNLRELTALGVRITLDDFGTGYASLSYLSRFPVTGIKIDRTFTRGLPVQPGGEGLLAAIVATGRELGLTVIAEGVETEDQAAYLRGKGCDELQGYLFSPALPAEQLVELLRRDTSLGAFAARR